MMSFWRFLFEHWWHYVGVLILLAIVGAWLNEMVQSFMGHKIRAAEALLKVAKLEAKAKRLKNGQTSSDDICEECSRDRGEEVRHS